MSIVLPFDIVAQIIDVVGESNDRDLLKNLALVSHSFLQICSKHLFATVEIHDASLSSKRGFVELLKSRPDVVKYIRKLTYSFGPNYQSLPPPTNLNFVHDDPQLPPILPSFVDDDPLLPPIPTYATYNLSPNFQSSLPTYPSFADGYLFPPPILSYNPNYNHQSLPLPTYPSSAGNDRLLPPTLPSFFVDDRLLSSILPNLLRTIPHLNCLTIISSRLDWNTLDSSLTSALLHLMHLPSVNHIDLSYIENFPLSNLTPSVNLLRLDIFCLMRFNTQEDDGDSCEIVQSELMPKLREFHTSSSSMLTRKLLHAKRQDGRPAFDLMNLRRLSLHADQFEDELNLRYLLQNAKLLEELCLRNGLGQSIVGLYDILFPSARTLKVLDLTLPLHSVPPPAGLCEELEALAGHNVLEALIIAFEVDGFETEDYIGSIIQKVAEVLIEPGWSALKHVSFKVEIACCLVSREDSAKLSEVLQTLPDKYLTGSLLSKQLEFNYSAYVVKCAYESD